MKRRLISFLMALVMVLTLLPVQAFAADPGNPFRDVKQGDWYYDAVQYARVNGFFGGTTPTAFSPGGTMTRGMFVTVLGRLAGVDTSRYQGKSEFTDVPANAYFAPYVAWAAQYGITGGTGAGKFSPYDPINRQQLAAFFVRYFEAFGVDYATGQDITTTPRGSGERLPLRPGGRAEALAAEPSQRRRRELQPPPGRHPGPGRHGVLAAGSGRGDLVPGARRALPAG